MDNAVLILQGDGHNADCLKIKVKLPFKSGLAFLLVKGGRGMNKHLIIAVLLGIFISNFASADTRFDITDLGTLGGEWTAATSINDLGQIVGWSQDTATQYVILWENGVMKNLNIIGEAMSINNLGMIVGHRENVTESQAFLWENGEVTQLRNAYTDTLKQGPKT